MGRKQSNGQPYYGSFVVKEEEIMEAHEKYTGRQLSQHISMIKKTFIEGQSNSSMSTIFALVNVMVGSIVLLLPVNFQVSGIAPSAIFLVLIGSISYMTCTWLIDNTKEGEDDLGMVIQRRLGPIWFKIFSLASSVLLFIVCIVFFQLINQTCWAILGFFFHFSGYNPPSTEKMVFNKFSIQWQCIVVMALLFPLLLLKKMNVIVKLAGLGSIPLYIYVAFIIGLFIQDAANHRMEEHIKELTIFPKDFTIIAQIIGNFAIAFMPHNAATSVLATNSNQKNNKRDLGISFAITGMLYLSIGMFGSFGILGRQSQVKTPQLIYDYFPAGNIPIFIIQLLILFNLVALFPMLSFLSKSQLFNVAFEDVVIPKWAAHVHNAALTVVCIVVIMVNVNINYVIGIAGTVVGFLIVYLIPSMMKLREGSKNHPEYVPEDDIQIQQEANNFLEQGLIQNQTLVDEKESQSLIENGNQISYTKFDVLQQNGVLIWIIIGIISIIGFSFAVLTFYSMFA